jgi:chromate reductase, NAD(P)H dehydrogenase (quinone)
MKVLAISGSLKSTSSNTAILNAIAAMAGKDIHITIFDGIGKLPHFSPDIDGDKSPVSVIDYRHQLKSSDGIIICTPEYAYGMPGVLKNALDWVVGSGEFVDKPVAVLSASPSFLGGDKAHASLVLTLSAINAKVVKGAKLTIPAIRSKINMNGEILDPELKEQLKAVLDTLIKAIKTNEQ